MADSDQPSTATLTVAGLTCGGLAGAELGQRFVPNLESSENGTLIAIGVGALVGGVVASIAARQIKRARSNPQGAPKP